MAKLLYKLGLFSIKRASVVIFAWLLVLGLSVGAFIGFHGELSSNVNIPGTKTEQVAQKLRKVIPQAAGGIANAVYRSKDGGLVTPQQRQQLANSLQDAQRNGSVLATIDPFAAELHGQQQAEKLAEGKKQLEQGAAQIAAQKTEIAQGKAALEAGKKQLEDAKLQLEWIASRLSASGVAASEHAQVSPEYAAAAAQIAAGESQLAATEKQLQAGEAQIAAAEREIAEKSRQAAAAGQLMQAASGVRQVSEDQSVAIATVVFTRSMLEVSPEDRRQVVQHLRDTVPAGLEVFFSDSLVREIPQVLGIGEVIGVGVALFVLLALFRSFITALVPVFSAVIGVGIGILATLSFSSAIEIFSVAPILGVMLGLAVGIDYSLFILYRHRTQLLAGMPVRLSIARATGTSGTAVAVAGLIVIIALAGLSLSGIGFLAMMGAVAAVCVSVAVAIALTLVPAILALLGERVLNAKARKQRAEAVAAGVAKADFVPNVPEGRAAGRTGRLIATVVAATALLVALALPATQMRLGVPDGASAEPGSSQHTAHKIVAEKFGEGATSPLIILAEMSQPVASDETLPAQQQEIVAKLSSMQNVTAVAPVLQSPDRKFLLFQLLPRETQNAASTAQLVHDLRALNDVPGAVGGKVDVAGGTSAAIDIAKKLQDALPLYLALVVGLSVLILVLVFRSLLLPLVATGGFVLTLAATFGAITAIYQQGFAAELFAVHDPTAILAFLPMIVLGVLFGLAMDYQLFLASGMREAISRGVSAGQAVRYGVKQGRAVVIAAALIMIAVFGGFIFSDSGMIRPIGFGLAFGVLLDAFVVRLLLVPAILELLGKSVWWLPSWLDRILPHVDVEGESLANIDIPNENRV
ncbi:MAG: MMPL family transporter [Microbacteriaceae bacterium]|nr:MMPL family transporter [Microbacteriaceae bacterium]